MAFDPATLSKAQRLKALQDAGYNGPTGNGEANAWLQNPANAARYTSSAQAASAPVAAIDTNGVKPIGQVEPFNQFQTNAFTNLATPQNTAYRTGYLDTFQKALAGIPDARPYFDKASEFLNQGSAPVTAQQIGATAIDLLNPARQEVQDRTLAGLEKVAGRNKAKILSSTPGGRSFGNSALGVQLGLNDEALISSSADALADLNYRTFSDAQNLGANILTGNRTRALTGAGTAGALGGSAINALTTAGNLATGGENLRRQGNLDLLYAGDRTQQQGQAYLDALRGEISGTRNYDQDQLNRLTELLKAFPTSSTGASAGSANTTSQVGGALTTLSQWLPLIAYASDIRLKRDIRPIGEVDGITEYEFGYRDPERHGEGVYRGVMAQDVEHIPGAVHQDPEGFLMVDYSKVPVEFRRVS